MNTTEKAAKILVSSGYAGSALYQSCIFRGDDILHVKLDDVVVQVVEPFEDSLYGRRQLDVIEDWLVNNRMGLWNESAMAVYKPKRSRHEERLLKAKWCLEQLPENEL